MTYSYLRTAMVAAGVLSASAVLANAKTLNFAQYGPDRGFQAEIVKQFAEDVKAATDGEVDVRITFGGALIDTRDVLRGVSDGVADLGSFIAVYTPAELFNFRVGDLPIGNVDPWIGASAMQELYETNDVIKGEFDKQNTILISNFTTTEVVLSCTEPVDSLDKFQGMKMRANPPHSLAFEKFGAAPVSVAITDVYQSLDRGVITCAQTYIPTIIPYRQYEVAKHVTTLDFGQNLAFGVVMNKRSFDGLTPEQQAAIKEAGRKLTEAYARESINTIAQSRAELEKEHGVTFHTLSPEDHKRLVDAGQVTVDAFLEKGDQGVLDQFIALEEKYESTLDEKGYPWAPM
jgi:TRAP-type C4-dicarboxylate transport system substrate-binding protein